MANSLLRAGCCCGGDCRDCATNCPWNADTNQPEPVIVTVTGACTGEEASRCQGAQGAYDFNAYSANQNPGECCTWYWNHEDWESNGIFMCLRCKDFTLPYNEYAWDFRIQTVGFQLFGNWPEIWRPNCKEGKLWGTVTLNPYTWNCDNCSATVTIPKDPR